MLDVASRETLAETERSSCVAWRIYARSVLVIRGFLGGDFDVILVLLGPLVFLGIWNPFDPLGVLLGTRWEFLELPRCLASLGFLRF